MFIIIAYTVFVKSEYNIIASELPGQPSLPPVGHALRSRHNSPVHVPDSAKAVTAKSPVPDKEMQNRLTHYGKDYSSNLSLNFISSTNMDLLIIVI